jgi:pantothenate kinase-related protein Tda10
MTHEPIRVIHFSPHITWQGTQAELDAMLAEGWPDGSASEIIAACKRDAAEAEAYAAELEAKLAKVIPLLGRIKSHKVFYMEELADLIAELKGQADE